MWLAGSALAGTAMVPYPPQTLEKAVPSWGGGFGWSDGSLQITRGAAFSGWSRYGLSDRVEALGGAWFTVQPLDIGVHGGLRASTGNPGGADGWGASAGLTAGAGGTFNVALPLEAGLQRRTVRVWLGAQPAIYPMLQRFRTTTATATTGGAVRSNRTGSGGPTLDATALVGTEVDVQGYGVTVTGGVNTTFAGGLGWFANLGTTWEM